jgi:hypothetical protein
MLLLQFSGDRELSFFISCPFARLVWKVVYVNYDIPPPSNIINMFRNWQNGIDKKIKAKISIRVSVLC